MTNDNQHATINVALCADTSYYEGLETSICSLAHACHRSLTSMTFYLVDGGITSAQKNTLLSQINHLKTELDTDLFVHWLQLTRQMQSDLSQFEHSFTYYVRLLLPELMHDVDWVVWVDSDILFTKDIGRINTYLDKHTPIFGCIDTVFPTLKNEISHPDKLNTHDFDLDSTYINTGISLINLELWRKNNITSELLAWGIANQKDCILFDQSIINWNLADRVGILPRDYNVIVDNPGTMIAGEEKDINYHFAGGYKPWLLNFQTNTKHAPLTFCKVVASYAYLKFRASKMNHVDCDRFERLHVAVKLLRSHLGSKPRLISLSITSYVRFLLYKIKGKHRRSKTWRINSIFYHYQARKASDLLLQIDAEIEASFQTRS